MQHLMSALRALSYPGRLVVLGRDASGRFGIVLYAVTGRSPASRARRLVQDGPAVWTRPTDAGALASGRADLLVYPAIRLGRGIAVSNGRQTADIDPDAGGDPAAELERALKDWSYEPDAPIHTPRISGCVLSSGRMALAILRRLPDGATERAFYELPAEPGRGRFLATYAGESRDPVPSFTGGPRELDLPGGSARETAEAAWAALGPSASGAPDFRVAAVCLFAGPGGPGEFDLHIINRGEGDRS